MVTVKVSMIQLFTVEVPIIECPIPDNLSATRAIAKVLQDTRSVCSTALIIISGSLYRLFRLGVVSSSGMLLTAFDMSGLFKNLHAAI